jgi:hypothetical protein
MSQRVTASRKTDTRLGAEEEQGAPSLELEAAKTDKPTLSELAGLGTDGPTKLHKGETLTAVGAAEQVTDQRVI